MSLTFCLARHVRLQVNPSQGDALCRCADLLRRRGETSSAESMYEKAHKAGVASAEAFVGWGGMLEGRGDLEAGLGVYTAAEVRFPGDGGVLKAMGEALLRQGKAGDAVHYLSKACIAFADDDATNSSNVVGGARNPTACAALVSLGDAILQRGGPKGDADAEAAYLSVLETAEGVHLRRRALQGVYRSLRARGDVDACEKMIETLTSSSSSPSSPSSPFPCTPLPAVSCLSPFQPDEAASCSSLPGAADCLEWVHVEHGRILESRGDASGAREAYKRALATDPVNQEAQCGLGSALRRLGDLQGAKEAFEQAYEQSQGTDVRAAGGLAVILIAEGKKSGVERGMSMLSGLGVEGEVVGAELCAKGFLKGASLALKCSIAAGGGGSEALADVTDKLARNAMCLTELTRLGVCVGGGLYAFGEAGGWRLVGERVRGERLRKCFEAVGALEGSCDSSRSASPVVDGAHLRSKTPEWARRDPSSPGSEPPKTPQTPDSSAALLQPAALFGVPPHALHGGARRVHSSPPSYIAQRMPEEEVSATPKVNEGAARPKSPIQVHVIQNGGLDQFRRPRFTACDALSASPPAPPILMRSPVQMSSSTSGDSPGGASGEETGTKGVRLKKLRGSLITQAGDLRLQDDDDGRWEGDSDSSSSRVPPTRSGLLSFADDVKTEDGGGGGGGRRLFSNGISSSGGVWDDVDVATLESSSPYKSTGDLHCGSNDGEGGDLEAEKDAAAAYPWKLSPEGDAVMQAGDQEDLESAQPLRNVEEGDAIMQGGEDAQCDLSDLLSDIQSAACRSESTRAEETVTRQPIDDGVPESTRAEDTVTRQPMDDGGSEPRLDSDAATGQPPDQDIVRMADQGDGGEDHGDCAAPLVTFQDHEDVDYEPQVDSFVGAGPHDQYVVAVPERDTGTGTTAGGAGGNDAGDALCGLQHADLISRLLCKIGQLPQEWISQPLASHISAHAAWKSAPEGRQNAGSAPGADNKRPSSTPKPPSPGRARLIPTLKLASGPPQTQIKSSRGRFKVEETPSRWGNAVEAAKRLLASIVPGMSPVKGTHLSEEGQEENQVMSDVWEEEGGGGGGGGVGDGDVMLDGGGGGNVSRYTEGGDEVNAKMFAVMRGVAYRSTQSRSDVHKVIDLSSGRAMGVRPGDQVMGAVSVSNPGWVRVLHGPGGDARTSASAPNPQPLFLPLKTVTGDELLVESWRVGHVTNSPQHAAKDGTNRRVGAHNMSYARGPEFVAHAESPSGSLPPLPPSPTMMHTPPARGARGVSTEEEGYDSQSQKTSGDAGEAVNGRGSFLSSPASASPFQSSSIRRVVVPRGSAVEGGGRRGGGALLSPKSKLGVMGRTESDRAADQEASQVMSSALPEPEVSQVMSSALDGEDQGALRFWGSAAAASPPKQTLTASPQKLPRCSAGGDAEVSDTGEDGGHSVVSSMMTVGAGSEDVVSPNGPTTSLNDNNGAGGGVITADDLACSVPNTTLHACAQDGGVPPEVEAGEDAMLGAANALAEAGSFEEAEAAYLRVLKGDAECVDALIGLGRLYSEQVKPYTLDPKP